MHSENEFHQLIVTDPGDQHRWLLWADWLEENGAADQAEVIRFRSLLTSNIEVSEHDLKEARLRDLVYKQQVAPPVIVRTSSAGLILHLIPPGEFLMGSSTEERGRSSDESQVAVRLTQGFWIGKYTVTFKQYAQIMNSNPNSEEANPATPVTIVSYFDALKFCSFLTAQERHDGSLQAGWEYSLPTEAQWEYACRAGSSTLFCFGDYESQLSKYAWYGRDYVNRPQVVGSKIGNGWGLHDMHGNVWEWCQDWYAQALGGGTDPRGPATGFYRCYRGGNIHSVARFVRLAHRNGDTPTYKAFNLSFRVVLVPVGSGL